MPELAASATAGVNARGYRRGATATDPWDQYVILASDRISAFRGRAATFVTPGRAGVTQRLLSLYNAAGSTVLVSVNRITVDLLTTVAKAATVQPPLIRVQRFSGVPTGGTALTKTPLDSAGTANASVTATGDSSADNGGAGTSSATALALPTPGGIIAQKYAPRMLTAVGYEPIDTAPFLYGEPDVVLRAGEGLAVSLDMATTSTGNPTTDKWVAEMDWEEYTKP